MFSYQGTVRRLNLTKLPFHFAVQMRALSGADAVNALRPFYFAVHPDFFGQHPKEREINENSLKRLNGYLENLQKPGFRAFKPTQLTFYVREKERKPSSIHTSFGPAAFRSVSFTLRTRDLLSTVLDVLNSCSLSTEHVQSADPNVGPRSDPGGRRPVPRPIKWDKTYYSFTGFKDPEEELEQARRTETTLSSWLVNNEKVAREKLTESVPLRKELERLKSELADQLQLTGIRWQRSWGIAHRCSQLHSLSRLTQQSPEALRNAKGCTVIFTDRSGMSATGHVMLGTTDVHQHWTKIFERLPSYAALRRKVQLLEDRISHLLGGIQINHVEELQPMMTLEEHYSILDGFYDRIRRGRLPFHPHSLRGLQMILERLVKLEEDLVKASAEKFSLRRLYKEPSISSVQMIHSCSKLQEESLPPLAGMHLCISHFYSVLQDGDLCIPWNWKSGVPTS